MKRRLCLRCERRRGVDKFYGCSTGRDGLHPWCQDCLKGYQAARYRKVRRCARGKA